MVFEWCLDNVWCLKYIWMMFCCHLAVVVTFLLSKWCLIDVWIMSERCLNVVLLSFWYWCHCFCCLDNVWMMSAWYLNDVWKMSTLCLAVISMLLSCFCYPNMIWTMFGLRLDDIWNDIWWYLNLDLMTSCFHFFVVVTFLLSSWYLNDVLIKFERCPTFDTLAMVFVV